MRSLTWKLTLAFLLVGLIGVLLVSVLVSQRTRSEFDRFLSARDRDVLISGLSDYYAANHSWENVGPTLAQTPPLSFYLRGAVVLDADGVVVVANQGYVLGQRVSSNDLRTATPVTLNSQVVGMVLLVASTNEPQRPTPDVSPEADFLQRIAGATIASAGVAALMALLLGGLLARTLTQPLRELTAATKAMAGGQFEQRVSVRSHDEIGALAASFNQMSADLQQASQARKQMTADLAHDLRTPLTILRGYAEGLQDGRLQGSANLYGIMYGEVVHLQRLVEDLRTLSLTDTGELPLNRRAVDPRALLERTGLAYIVQATQQGIALRVEAPESLPSIHVDTDRMTQVLNNLVSNALRHTQHGEIVLAAKVVGAAVHMTVSDTGVGIEAADLPLIFDRFYSTDRARQRNDSDATGLGLAIAKAIVEAHGGSLTVASSPGQGTTFTMTISAASV